MRPWAIGLLILAALVFLVGSAEAHRQGLRAGYERLAYDCSHDWGWESGQPDDLGHELVTLDVIEAEIEGRPMLVFEMNFVQASSILGQRPAYGMKETLSFTASRGSFSTTLVSTSEAELVYESGLRPAYIGPRKAGLTGIGWDATTPDDALIAFDVGYTYAQLRLQNEERLTDYGVVASYQTPDGRWMQGDILPGGTTSQTGAHEPACKNGRHAPEDDETYYRAPYFEVERSDWTVPRATPTPAPEPTPNAPPVANFSWTPVTPRAGENVTFTDASHDADGSIAHRAWAVDGVAAGAEPNLTRSFAEPGVRVVELVVTDNRGANATLRANVTIAPRPEPVAPTPAPTPPTRPAPTPAPVETPPPAEQPPPSPPPPEPVGPTPPTPTPRDPPPARDPDPAPIAPPTPPVVDIILESEEPRVGKQVAFQAHVYDPDGLVARLQWRIGEETFDGPRVTHVPQRAGSLAVTLEAFGPDAALAHSLRHVDVAPAPLEARIATNVEPEGIRLRADLTGDAVAWEWFLPNGSVARTESVMLPSSAAGGRVGLVVTDREGQVATAQADIPGERSVVEEAKAAVPGWSALVFVAIAGAAARRRAR